MLYSYTRQCILPCVIYLTCYLLGTCAGLDQVYRDGTFDKAPKHYIIYSCTRFMSRKMTTSHLQLVYCFLPSKNVCAYEDMWVDLSIISMELINDSKYLFLILSLRLISQLN